MVTIPYGVNIPSACPDRRPDPHAALKIVYAGRLVQYQKRVLDLAKIVIELDKKNIPFDLIVAGDGLDRGRLERRLNRFITEGKVRFLGPCAHAKVLSAMEDSDVVIMTSGFEGMPLSLLEAMSRGCIPVVTDLASGIPELIESDRNGYRVKVGDIHSFAERLAFLQSNPGQRQAMMRQAYQTIANSKFCIQNMGASYEKLFQRVRTEIEAGRYCRPRGRRLQPPLLPEPWLPRIPDIIRMAGLYAQHRFRRSCFG
ncbi:MAG: glycosyltransferase [Candidatus Omnitrophica bacterium]|nr:glycosyltransferase [Candidatus Omnitrophota bacterium]